MKTKDKKQKKSTKWQRAEFPKITTNLAIQYLEKIVSKIEGEPFLFESIGKAIGKFGGNLNRIVASLQDFGLLERGDKPKEWKVTELGKRIVQQKSDTDIFKAFLNPPIHAKIWNEYKQRKPNKDALVNYLNKEGFTLKASNKLAKLFLQSYDQFSTKIPLTISSKEEKIKVIEKKDDNKKTYLAYLVSSIFPSEIGDAEEILNEIIKIAKEENLQKLSTGAEFIKINLAGKKKEEIKEELKKFSSQMKRIMKEELGIEK